MSTENINLMNKVYNSRAENGIHLTNKLNMGPLIRLQKQEKKKKSSYCRADLFGV